MNQVVLIGRLTRDPELNYTQSGTAKCVFTLAVDRPQRRGEEKKADFIRITVWSKQTENCGRYLHKGARCAVTGAVRTDSYKNREGVTVYTTDIWANNVEFLDSVNKSADKPAQTANNSVVEPVTFNDLPDSFSAAEDDIPFRT